MEFFTYVWIALFLYYIYLNFFFIPLGLSAPISKLELFRPYSR